MEQLDKYKYLDMFIDDKLSFDHKTEDLQEGTLHIVTLRSISTLLSSFAHLVLSQILLSKM